MPAPDTIQLDCIFVPDGDTPPVAWLQDHPNHIRLPATLVSDPRTALEPD
jgi:hypothetical protein